MKVLFALHLFNVVFQSFLRLLLLLQRHAVVRQIQLELSCDVPRDAFPP